jgi:hypothetical protein
VTFDVVEDQRRVDERFPDSSLSASRSRPGSSCRCAVTDPTGTQLNVRGFHRTWHRRESWRVAPSRLVEFETDSVYAVRRDAHATGVRLRQFQNQEHRTGYAKRTEGRHGDGRAAGL